MSTTSSEEDSASFNAPSERFESYGEARRRAVYRSWPPPNTESYPVWKRYPLFRGGVEGVPEFVGSSGDETEESLGPVESILKDKWQELAECKLKLDTIRIRLKNQRSRLRQARQERDAADNYHMSLLRSLRLDFRKSSVTTSTKIDESFQRLQQTRDICQTYEMALETTERDLGTTHADMDRFQRRLINALRSLDYAKGERNLATIQAQPRQMVNHDIEPQPPQSEVLIGLEIDPASQCSAMYQHLMAGLGLITTRKKHRARLRARMVDLQSQHRQILMFEKMQPAALQRIPRLTDSDLEFMRTFQEEEKRITADVANLQEEVEEVTKILWDDNILPHELPLHVVLGWYPGDFSIDHDLEHSPAEAADTEPEETADTEPEETADTEPEEAADTEPADYSVLLSSIGHLLEGFPMTASSFLEIALDMPDGSPRRNSAIISAAKEVFIQNLLIEAKDKLNFVNRWLLQNLRSSRHEVDILFSCHTTTDGTEIDDLEQWQWGILKHWWDIEAQTEIRALFEEEHVGSLDLSGIFTQPPSWLSDPFLVQGEDSDVSTPDFEAEQSDHSDGMRETETRAAFFSAFFAENADMSHLPKALGQAEEGHQENAPQMIEQT